MNAEQRDRFEQVLADYNAAEDALRAFTDRNFGRMCAVCARWTLLAAQVNATPATPRADPAPGDDAASSPGRLPHHEPDDVPQVTWRLSSWVTNCCNANHALESMSDDSLAGVVASRDAGRAWWERVERAAGAPCQALTGSGCALKRGRPELCNSYFCEAVRDYLWEIGGPRHGPGLAARLDDLQQRWGVLYTRYQAAVLGARLGKPLPPAHQLRGETGWRAWQPFLDAFDRVIARHVRPVTAQDLAGRFFKVSGERAVYEPFFEREVAAINGQIRVSGPAAPPESEAP